MDAAYRELQTKLSSMNIGDVKKAFATVHVVAGTAPSLSDGAGLPATILYPQILKERLWGSTDKYLDMSEQTWSPDVSIVNELSFWVWQENKILFPGSLTDREVLIEGVQTLGKITSGTSPIQILNCDIWLAQRTAAIAALTIGANPTRAKALNDDLDKNAWNDLKATLNKRKGNIPVRRMRTRYRQA
jgi:hypothetical protein